MTSKGIVLTRGIPPPHLRSVHFQHILALIYCFHSAVLGAKILVMSQADLLYRLQQIDDEIRESKKRLAQVIKLRKESTILEAARDKAQKSDEVLSKCRGKQKALNLELSGLNEKSMRGETRLYSGTVRNPKELEDIQHELESLRRRSSGLEDELIDAMIMFEESEEEASAAAQELETVEASWKHNQASLKEEQAELIEIINQLTIQRNHHLTLVTSESLAAYENAIRRAGSMAVVPLKGRRCSGCRVTVPANLVKLVEDGTLTTCDNCTRILIPT